MKKIIWPLIVMVMLIVLIALAGVYKFNIKGDDVYVQTSSGEVVRHNDIIQVSTSIVPLASVVNTIGGDYVEVENTVPAGVSPHGFDLSAKQMAKLSESEVVFMIGLEHIDGFLDKAVTDDKQIHLADGMELIEVEGHHHDEHGEEDHDDHMDDEYNEDHEDEDDHHDEGHIDEEHHEDKEGGHEDNHDDHSSDPHVWLGKSNISTMAYQIRDELTVRLPEQAEYFTKNADKFVSDLDAIYADFDLKISGKTPKEFIVFHDAYNYLMQSVNMDPNLKVPFSENVLHDTGAAHMVELIEEIELHGISLAFVEPQFEGGNLQKFANEHSLSIGVLDPLGADITSTGYLKNIKNNLKNLAKIYE